MAYTKNTWLTDDIITADKLNNIENGILGQYSTPATFTDFNTVAGGMNKYQGFWYVQGTGVINGPTGTTTWSTVEVIRGNSNATGLIRVIPFNSSTVYVSSVNGGNIVGWARLAENESVVHKTGDETVSGNKTFSGTTNTTGYLKQKRWSTTASIGGNTFILNRIGDVIFASGQVTTVLTGETTASGTLPTGFRPSANFVITTNRGITTRSLLFQSNGSVWVPELVNVDSYISGTYLAEDTLPTI
ncbi:baseplate protein [Leuconostoc phage 1-A4]|uniref:Baseplate protein n=1 Tax=Leuconostoc phage 1-A4 TaxID=745088 RepID=D4N4L1_9CAUD|nr:baseplate protein [Leuconostoc phage 1-A4]ADD71761.1 baseplate protein [Leuconostoc phage 1-A4]